MNKLFQLFQIRELSRVDTLLPKVKSKRIQFFFSNIIVLLLLFLYILIDNYSPSSLSQLDKAVLKILSSFFHKNMSLDYLNNITKLLVLSASWLFIIRNILWLIHGANTFFNYGQLSCIPRVYFLFYYLFDSLIFAGLYVFLSLEISRRILLIFKPEINNTICFSILLSHFLLTCITIIIESWNYLFNSESIIDVGIILIIGVLLAYKPLSVLAKNIKYIYHMIMNAGDKVIYDGAFMFPLKNIINVLIFLIFNLLVLLLSSGRERVENH